MDKRTATSHLFGKWDPTPPVATDPLADKPDAPQTMQPPQTEVGVLQHQVDGLTLQLTEITVLLTNIITSKTNDVDDAPAPVTAQDRSARSN